MIFLASLEDILTLTPHRWPEPRDRWTWEDVFIDCWTIERERMIALREDVKNRGIVDPISVRSSDGHVTDGHHRVVIAMTLGYSKLSWKIA